MRVISFLFRRDERSLRAHDGSVAHVDIEKGGEAHWSDENES